MYNSSYFIILSISCAIMGLIPAYIAKSKGRSFLTWYIYGFFLFFFAMIHSIVLPETNNSSKKIKIVAMESADTNKDTNENFYVDIYCPAETKNYNIKVDEITGITYCSIGLLNLSDKSISAVKIDLSCFDSFGQPVNYEGSNIVNIIIQDQNGKPGTVFGFEKTIPLPNHINTRKLNIVIKEILFCDKTIWKKGDYELYNVTNSIINNSEELKNIRQFAGQDAVCYSGSSDKVWTCVCGRLNLIDSHSCVRCRRDKEKILSKFNNKESVDELLRLNNEAKMASEQAAKRKAEENRKKIAIISAMTVCLIAVVFAMNYFYKENTYNKALALIKQNKYDEAMTAFKKVPDYRDSGTYIKKEVSYQKALKKVNKADFNNAIPILNELQGYRDSDKLLNYELAVKDFNDGYYDSAYSEFSKFKGYRDSDKMLAQAQQNLAEEKEESEKIKKAYEAFMKERAVYMNDVNAARDYPKTKEILGDWKKYKSKYKEDAKIISISMAVQKYVENYWKAGSTVADHHTYANAHTGELFNIVKVLNWSSKGTGIVDLNDIMSDMKDGLRNIFDIAI